MFFNLFTTKTFESIDTTTLKNQYLTKKKDYYFIDVRTKPEFKSNHIRGFENIPLDNLQNNLKKIPKNKEVVVICQSGGRSSAACQLLSQNGYKVTNVLGGMNNWRN